MATEQLLIRLPEDLARRLRRRVPARARSAFVQRLLEQALPAEALENDPLKPPWRWSRKISILRLHRFGAEC